MDHLDKIKKGDIVLNLGDSLVVDMMSYMRALSVFKKGDKSISYLFSL